MYLGLHKHNLAWPCLREALEELLPGRYLFEPRFQLNERTGKWEYLVPAVVKQIVSTQGWKVLEGTIAPDIVIMDAHGVIIHVYEIKFPCPESNEANWHRYMKGRWETYRQDGLYREALHVRPRLVSPYRGWEPLPR